MSFNVFSTIAGGITIVGGGFGIYLWSSRENNTNAENVPTKTEKPTEKASVVEKPRPKIKPKRKFLNSEQKTSGKILSVIKDDTDYTDQITPYTLYECMSGLDGFWDSCVYSASKRPEEITLKLNGNKVLEVDLEKKADDTKLPFFYFDYENDQYPDKPEDLDFSKLKQMTANTIKFQKYLLIFGNKDDQTANQKFSISSTYRSLNPNQWGNKFDENGKLITSSSLKMEIIISNFVNDLLWKPIFSLNKNFDALDQYEEVKQKFSEENKNLSA